MLQNIVNPNIIFFENAFFRKKMEFRGRISPLMSAWPRVKCLHHTCTCYRIQTSLLFGRHKALEFRRVGLQEHLKVPLFRFGICHCTAKPPQPEECYDYTCNKHRRCTSRLETGRNRGPTTSEHAKPTCAAKHTNKGFGLWIDFGYVAPG